METIYHEVCLSPTLDFQEPSSEVVPRTTMQDPLRGEKGEETVMTVVLVSQLPLLVVSLGRRNEKSKVNHSNVAYHVGIWEGLIPSYDYHFLMTMCHVIGSPSEKLTEYEKRKTTTDLHYLLFELTDTYSTVWPFSL